LERDAPQVDISMEENTQQSRKKRSASADTFRISGNDDSIDDNGDDSDVPQPPPRKRTVAGARFSHVRRPQMKISTFPRKLLKGKAR
jgi:hypothetical protein